MQCERLQVWRPLQDRGGKAAQGVVSKVEMAQGGEGEVSQQGEGAESVWVELLKPVALQLDEPEPRQALEGVRVDAFQAVVVQVEPCQAP